LDQLARDRAILRTRKNIRAEYRDEWRELWVRRYPADEQRVEQLTAFAMQEVGLLYGPTVLALDELEHRFNSKHAPVAEGAISE